MKIKVKFYATTGYVGSEINETLELDVDECLTEEEREKLIEETFNDWLWENIDAGWISES